MCHQSMLRTGQWWTERIKSPGSMPTCSAGESGCTSVTSIPIPFGVTRSPNSRLRAFTMILLLSLLVVGDFNLLLDCLDGPVALTGASYRTVGQQGQGDEHGRE